MTNPTLTVVIDNLSTVIKALAFTDTEFAFSGTTEAEIVVKAADGYFPITISHIDTVKKIIIVPATGTTCTLKITIDDGIDPAFDIELEVNKIFVLDTTTSFGDKITGLALKTASVGDIIIQARIYGV